VEAARADTPAPPLRLSPIANPAAAGGCRDQPQEDLAALPRREAGGPTKTEPTSCDRSAGTGACAGAAVLALPNQRWSLDFVHEQMAAQRRFRVPDIVDGVTREYLRAVPNISISEGRVVRELVDLIADRGKLGVEVIRSSLSQQSCGQRQWRAPLSSFNSEVINSLPVWCRIVTSGCPR